MQCEMARQENQVSLITLMTTTFHLGLVLVLRMLPHWKRFIGTLILANLLLMLLILPVCFLQVYEACFYCKQDYYLAIRFPMINEYLNELKMHHFIFIQSFLFKSYLYCKDALLNQNIISGSWSGSFLWNINKMSGHVLYLWFLFLFMLFLPGVMWENN